MSQNSFEKLIVWQKSMDLVRQTYNLTKLFPKEDVYGITSQMRRSAVSIPSNIAEGSKMGSKKDFNRFLRIASGSTAELFPQVKISEDLYNIDGSIIHPLITEIQKMLSVMIRNNKE